MNHWREAPVLVRALDTYDPQGAQAIVEEIFALWPGAAQLGRDTRVTIKPNLLMRRAPERATTTHPVIVGAVVAALRRRGVERITIADSPGGPYTQGALKGIYQSAGMTALGEELLNYDVTWKRCPAPAGGLVEEFNLITPVAQADVVIDVAKMKTHGMTTLSGGVKNLFGCVPGLQKPQLHYQYPQSDAFCQMLVDLALTVGPALTIVDGVVAMEGDGPSGGEPRQVGYLVGSTSPFAADLVLAHMMDLPVEGIATLVHGRERGLVPGDVEELKLLGDPCPVLHDFKRPASRALDFTDHMPGVVRPLAKLVQRFTRPRPVIRRDKCVGCGKCAESCPAHTIEIVEGKAVIHYDKCISCFCCHEMCPFQFIDMGRGLLPRGRS